MDPEDSEENISKLSDWFTSVCKFQPPLAHQLASELVNSCGITGYEQFPILQQADPNWLNNLECTVPTLAKILVKVNVEKIGRTPLRSLDLEDVRGILDACYAEFPYGKIFKEKQISGFNLSYVENVEGLKAFGVTNDIHATTLFASVTEWKRVGVPNELIASNTLRNVHIKEEAYREATRANSASSRGISPAPSASAGAIQQENVEEPVEPDTYNRSRSSSAHITNDEVAEMEFSNNVAEGAENNPVVIISSSSATSSSTSSSSSEGEAHEGQLEHTTQQSAIVDPAVQLDASGLDDFGADGCSGDDREQDQEAMDESPETPQSSHILPAHTEVRVAGNATADKEGRVSPYAFLNMVSATSTGNEQTSQPSSSRAFATSAAPATAPTPASFSTTTTLIDTPAEPKARVQQRSISEAKQQKAKPALKPKTKRPLKSTTLETTPTVNPVETYREYFNGRPFPGMPQHALLQSQYAEIAQRMGDTQVNMEVQVTEHQAEMLRALPEQLIGGKWIVKDTNNHHGRGSMQTYDLQKQIERRENSLVFVPSDRIAAEEAVASVQPSKEAPIHPSAEFMIVIIVPSPEERKKRALELHAAQQLERRNNQAAGRAGDDASEDDLNSAHESNADSSSSDSESLHLPARSKARVANTSSFSPTVSPNPRSNRKRARSPSVQDQEDDAVNSEYSLRQRPKRSSAGVKGAILDLEAKALLPRRGARSVSSTSSSTGFASTPAGSARRHSSARHVVSPSGHTPTSSSTITRRASERHSLGASSSAGAGSSSSKGGAKTVSGACHDIMHSRDNKDLINGVNFLGTATVKNGREAVDYIVKSGTYQRLLHFIHLAPQLPSTFVYYVLRTVSLIVTRLDGLSEIEIIFEKNRFKDIVKLCGADNDFVREQSLHLVSEIGVSDEHGLKQRVLNAGAVQAIIECYNNVECFSNPKTAARIQGQCARSLYKLTSMSTPKQFPTFVPALRVLHDVLLNPACNWVAVVEAAQAVSFLVMPDQPRQIEVLMEHSLFDVLVSIFQDSQRNSALRWHASIFVWSVAKHCSNAQMRKLFRLMGILGSVCHTDNAHPHLRAAALNIMQVMLLRGDFIVQQFVYHRDKIPTIVMDLLRAHRHEKLVHGDSRSANCIIKYASFTLTNAVIGANKEQLLKLLDLGAYPLLFKIISLEGEDERPEEVKLKGVTALCHILQEVPNEIRTTHHREAHKRSNPTAVADAWWAVVRGLVEDSAQDEEDLSFVSDPALSPLGAAGGLGVGGATSSSSSGGASAALRRGVRNVDYKWSEELREKAQELIDMAHEVELL